MKYIQLISILTLLWITPISSQEKVNIIINADSVLHPISPYIYGKNNCISDTESSPTSASEWQRLKDLGIRFFRESGGNNSTKYNWRRKLSSHPDWYNNVFYHNWDYEAQTLQQNIPSAQGMWAFQLVGKAAKTDAFNFSSWNYNQAQYWEGVRQNLCGGGTVNEEGGEDALEDGDPSLYLEDWNADSTAGILDHWFGDGGFGLDPQKAQYWSMDNEPEIWEGTHDDVWPVQPDAEDFMQMYFEVAKKARAKFPDIKLTGPVPANEWQWYNWSGSSISYEGEEYVWLEYFIKRIAEEQQATGIRLLDVLDIHFYPTETDPAEIVQLHRVYFDRDYIYPGANGVKRLGSSGWDNSINKEYIFERCRKWLEKYMGPDHGVKFAVTETGIKSTDPNVVAVWYASNLGEFAKQEVEIFTPWHWETGMYEVLHLFSRYGKDNYANATSSNEEFISAYPTLNDTGDSLVIFLVNRHLSNPMETEIDLDGFPVNNSTYDLLALNDLPSGETFISHENNALTTSSVEIKDHNAALVLPPLSVSALIVTRADNYDPEYGFLIAEAEAEDGILSGTVKSSTNPGFSGTGYVTGFDNDNDKVTVSMDIPQDGFYRLVIRYNAPNGNKHQDLSVNGGPAASLFFEQTSSYGFVDAGKLLLEKGPNSFTIIKNWGWSDIDKFLLYQASKNHYQPANSLVDPDAEQETIELYEFLKLQFGKRMISGQTHDYYDEILSLTGKSPMLRTGDFQSYTEGYPYIWKDGGHTFGKYDNGTVDELINWYNSTGGKGIVSFQWHWHSPSGGEAGTNTFWTDFTDFDVTRAVVPGNPEYDDIIRDIDDIAAELKKFQAAGIPILWRPLHEAGGGWFWWGAKGPEACLELYDIIYDRLMNHHQIHNLIWVWSTPEEAWYPGNDKVDIIGHDSYPGEFNYGTQKTAFDRLYRLTEGKKLIAMTENGPIPDPDNCFEEDAPWLLFMSWSDLVTEQNSNDHIIEVYSNSSVLTLESQNAITGNEWRSSLYPENWKPGYKDEQGRFLHDFSYAGYHKSEVEIPYITANIINITQAPYNADNTGLEDVTAIIQQALDDAGTSGGGVVYLPEGTYRIKPPSGKDITLRIRYDNVVLRGDGPGKTFLFNDESYMRFKDIIRVSGDWAGWFNNYGSETNISYDLTEPTRIIPVESVSGFQAGDDIILHNPPTEAFIAEHKMEEIWTADAIKGVAFKRVIDSIDTENKLLFIDAPTRYFLKTRDGAKVYHAGDHLTECGIENLSIGNRENTKSGWDEESYSQNGTGAWDVHFSHAIQFAYSENCWIKNVETYGPDSNQQDIHILSNCLLLNSCRQITVDSCFFQKPQYEGGGGNGYMYTLQSNDCLIKSSRANHSRHNFDFKYPFSSGNVIYNCRGENSKYSSDFHMYLSMANLFDNFTVNGDYLESDFRPYGGDAIHGYSSTQSVFYNTFGEAYHPQRDYLIESKQYGWGYVIGSSGPASRVITTPVSGTTNNGYDFDTAPEDMVEGEGNGENLVPESLYLDQLQRRLDSQTDPGNYNLVIKLIDEVTNLPIQGAEIKVLNILKTSNESGKANFDDVYYSFEIAITKENYLPFNSGHIVIYSDTTLEFILERNDHEVQIRLVDEKTLEPFWGVTIQLGDQIKVTDNEGSVRFTVDQGEHEYSFEKISYRPETGTLNIISDSLIEFLLVRTHADVKFRLRRGTTPVNDATVRVDNDSLLSNSLGIAHFRQAEVSRSYDYFIRCEGYQDVEGIFFLSTDTTIEISMTELTSLENDPKTIQGPIFWPNPANEEIFLKIPEDYFGVILKITDLNGKSFLVKEIHLKEEEIGIEKLENGMYVLQLISDSGVNSFVLVKE